MTDFDQDIRWEQRFANFKKALSQLKKFVDKGDLSELEEQGAIQSFEYTYELAWNVLKDFLQYQGQTDIYGSRDAIRKAFQAGLIEEGEKWMDAYVSRTKTSHTYNEETAKEVVAAILNEYYGIFVALEKKMASLLADKRDSGAGKRFGIEEPMFLQLIGVLADNHQVEEAIIYGSRAKGVYKPGSDIDLALKGESLDLEELNKINLALDDLLIPYTVDLSIYHRIDNPDLLDHIKRVGKIFYRREPAVR
jgi:nucleotidyltransferase substrate binding protein (TIGR01987 family)